MEHFSIWCGILLGPIFIIIFLIEGFIRAGYQPLRQPVSALSIGTRGWIQRANFYITGILALIYGFGISSWLIAIFGVGLIGAGIFVTDQTGLPRIKEPRTRSGILHDLFSLPVFLALLIDCFISAYTFNSAGEAGWAAYSAISGILLAVFFVLAGKGFAGSSPQFSNIGGLMQRLSIASGWIWVSAVAAQSIFL